MTNVMEKPLEKPLGRTDGPLAAQGLGLETNGHASTEQACRVSIC